MAAKPSRIIRHNGTVAESESPEHRGFSREEFTGGNSPASQGVHPLDDAERLSGTIRPGDLKDYNGPLFVINKTKSMISHDDGKGNVLRIEPVYNRDHIAPLPLEVARHIGFQRLWRTGRIQVTTDPSVEDYLTLENPEGSPEDQGGILPYTLESNADNDLTPLECLVCQESVFMTGEEVKANTAPLCDAHIDSPDLVEQVLDANKNLVWKLKDTVSARAKVRAKTV
jgi:hypothetical protein